MMFHIVEAALHLFKFEVSIVSFTMFLFVVSFSSWIASLIHVFLVVSWYFGSFHLS